MQLWKLLKFKYAKCLNYHCFINYLLAHINATCKNFRQYSPDWFTRLFCFMQPYFSKNLLFIIFSRKKNFERKIFILVVGVLFLFLKLSMTRRIHKSAVSLVSCVIQVSVVIVVQKLAVAGSNPAIDHIFYVFLENR